MIFSTLESPIRWIFLAHALAGALALLVMAVPLVSKKGGKAHTKTGWIYTASMVFVGFSAFALTPWRFFFDPAKTTASENFAVFLFYISVFTLSAIAYGLTPLRAKQRKDASRALRHVGPPIATVLVGLATQFIGFKSQNVLLMAFPFLGHSTSVSQFRYWLREPRSKMHWWYAHMNGMIVACIATMTAFLVTAVPRLWPGPIAESPVLWIAPGVILGTILNRWTASYASQFEKVSR